MTPSEYQRLWMTALRPAHWSIGTFISPHTGEVEDVKVVESGARVGAPEHVELVLELHWAMDGCTVRVQRMQSKLWCVTGKNERTEPQKKFDAQ